MPPSLIPLLAAAAQAPFLWVAMVASTRVTLALSSFPSSRGYWGSLITTPPSAFGAKGSGWHIGQPPAQGGSGVPLPGRPHGARKEARVMGALALGQAGQVSEASSFLTALLSPPFCQIGHDVKLDPSLGGGWECSPPCNEAGSEINTFIAAIGGGISFCSWRRVLHEAAGLPLGRKGGPCPLGRPWGGEPCPSRGWEAEAWSGLGRLGSGGPLTLLPPSPSRDVCHAGASLGRGRPHLREQCQGGLQCAGGGAAFHRGQPDG